MFGRKKKDVVQVDLWLTQRGEISSWEDFSSNLLLLQLAHILMKNRTWGTSSARLRVLRVSSLSPERAAMEENAIKRIIDEARIVVDELKVIAGDEHKAESEVMELEEQENAWYELLNELMREEAQGSQAVLVSLCNFGQFPASLLKR